MYFGLCRLPQPIEVRFIEYMPFDGNKWNDKKMFSCDNMLQTIGERWPEFGLLEDAEPNATATVSLQLGLLTGIIIQEAEVATDTPGPNFQKLLSPLHNSTIYPKPMVFDWLQVYKVPGYRGTVGFIASMTKPFCGSCNRLRLTADGNLKVNLVNFQIL